MRRNARKARFHSVNAEKETPSCFEYVHHKHLIPARPKPRPRLHLATNLVGGRAVGVTNGVESSTTEEVVFGSHEVRVASDG